MLIPSFLLASSLAPILEPPLDGHKLWLNWNKGQSYYYRVDQTVFEPIRPEYKVQYFELFEVLEETSEHVQMRITQRDSSVNPKARLVTVKRNGDFESDNKQPLSWVRFSDQMVGAKENWYEKFSKCDTPFGQVEFTSIHILRAYEMLGNKQVARVISRVTMVGPNVSGSGTKATVIDVERGNIITSTANYVLVINSNGERRTVPWRIEVKKI